MPILCKQIYQAPRLITIGADIMQRCNRADNKGLLKEKNESIFNIINL